MENHTPDTRKTTDIFPVHTRTTIPSNVADSQTFSVRITDKRLRDAIRKYADNHRWKPSAAIRVILEDFFDISPTDVDKDEAAG